MKRFVCLGVLAVAFGLGLPAPAGAQEFDYSTTEQVTNFDASIALESDGSFTVTEAITYDFSFYEHHGIFRDIPYSYSRSGTKYNVRIKVLGVEADGDLAPFETTRSGGYLHLKIGDPAVTSTGEHTYQITYSVERAINYFDDHDELYWNVTGNEWTVPLLDASAVVSFNFPITGIAGDITSTCYTGPVGATDQQCARAIDGDESIPFTTTRKLAAGEGLTIVVGVPRGVFSEPTGWQRFGWFVVDNWPVALPVVTLGILFYLWWTRGRDPAGRRTIVAEYEAPDKLIAAEVGVIVDEKADLKDISATIIELAVAGFLKIRALGKSGAFAKPDYELIRLKPASGLVDPFQRVLFEELFGSAETKKLSDLKNKFYTKLPDLKTKLYDGLHQAGYFPKSPEKVRNTYIGIGSLVLVFGFIGAVSGFLMPLAGGAVVLSGVIILLFSQSMSRRSSAGVAAREKIEGLKLYLTVAEKERIKFHNAPEKKPELFEKLLPYAMVLGVEKQWAGQFADLYRQPPSWYDGSFGTHFTTLYLVSALSDFNRSAQTVVASRPSSAGSGGSGFGGGGFSGGGFGGGGGGSW